MSKKPWTAERRWKSLVKKGVLAPDASPRDLEELTLTVSSALSPTIYRDGVRSADLRLLFEVFVDALATYLARDPEEVRADRAPAVWHLESIARTAGDLLDAAHRLGFLENAVRIAPRSVVLRSGSPTISSERAAARTPKRSATERSRYPPTTRTKISAGASPMHSPGDAPGSSLTRASGDGSSHASRSSTARGSVSYPRSRSRRPIVVAASGQASSSDSSGRLGPPV